MYHKLLKCGFCKKLLLYECNSDQFTKVRFASFLSGGFITAVVVNPPESKLAKRTYEQLPTFFFILSSLLGGFAAALLLHPPKSDDKIKKWATGQSCIRKEETSYKIHTLERFMNSTTYESLSF